MVVIAILLILILLGVGIMFFRLHSPQAPQEADL